MPVEVISQDELRARARRVKAIVRTGDFTAYSNLLIVSGGGGRDVLSGGTGRDIFLFDVAASAANADTVTDFATADDVIALDDACYAAVGGPGALAATAFWTGSAAHDANDRIIYNAASGALYYDADGTGAGAQVQIATLSAGLSLAGTNFLVV
jgi:serralysin